jgi:hypothetical protein
MASVGAVNAGAQEYTDTVLRKDVLRIIENGAILDRLPASHIDRH